MKHDNGITQAQLSTLLRAALGRGEEVWLYGPVQAMYKLTPRRERGYYVHLSSGDKRSPERWAEHFLGLPMDWRLKVGRALWLNPKARGSVNPKS